MNKQPEITDATRAALKSAFISLARKNSVRKISIKEITDIAGYSRITFYRYFTDVYDVLESIEDDCIDAIKNGISEYVASHDTIDSSFVYIFLDAFQEKNAEFSIVFSDENRISMIKHLQSSLTDGFPLQIKETYRNKLIMETYFNGVFSAITMHMNNPGKMTELELAGILNDLLSNWFWPQISVI